jgi:hypothetical protein
MYIDTQTEFSDAQAVTSTAISTNVVDLFASVGAGTALTADSTLDIGQGEDIYVVIQTQTTCTDTGSDATVTFTVESDSAAGLASAPVVHFSTGALAFATYATAGTRVATICLPSGSYKRYLGVRYTVASGPLTAGAFDAFLTVDPAAVRRVYKTGYTVA